MLESRHRFLREFVVPLGLTVWLVLLAVHPASAQVVGSSWTPIGPAPLKGFFAGGVVGRATAIALNPFNGDQVWLGTAAGGIWYSPDGAVHWYPLTDDQAALAIGDIVVRGCDSNGCTQILAGTGENAIRRDTYYGYGFLVGDREKTGTPPDYSWTLRTGSPGADFSLGSINDVVTDPFALGGGPIYITLSSGVTSSASQSTLTAPEPGTGYGIYVTANTGASWTKLNVPGSGGAVPTDLEMHPGDDQTLWAGFLGVGIFETTDGGTTWCPLSPGTTPPPGCTARSWDVDPTLTAFDFIEIAVSPSNPLVMYATFGHCSDPLVTACLPSVYRSSNGGNSWQRRIAGDSTDGGDNDYKIAPYGYSRYTHALTVHPTDPNEAFIGGLRLFRTEDGFATVATADRNTAPGQTQWGAIIHLDHHDVAFDPGDPSRVYDTNDGGIYVTTDIEKGWVARNNLGLQITGFHSLTLGSGMLLGGAQDNGILVYDGLPVWDSMDLAGDGGFTVVDAANPHRWYALKQKGDVYSTPDQGGSWCPVNVNLPSVGQYPAGEARNMYAPFIQDPSFPHDLYWGGETLWRSPRPNSSDCWGNIGFSRISPPLGTGDEPEVTGGKDAISAVAVAPSDGNRVYFGYYGGGLWRTDAACADPSCWTDVGVGLPDQPITRIAVHPEDRDTVVVTLSGFDDVAKVWRTTTGGGAWTASATGLPSGVPANTVHYEPGFPDRLWLGLDGNPSGSSVFRSTSGGTAWTDKGHDLPNVPVYDMAFFQNGGHVYVGTHGRGAFYLGGGLVVKKEIWKEASQLALALTGLGLPSGASCDLGVIREDDSVCASGSTDAMGATIRTDGSGRLITDRTDYYDARPMAWACIGDRCVGDTPADACRLTDNPPVRLTLDCGAASYSVDLDGPHVATTPRPVHLGVTVLPESPTGAGGTEADHGDGSFDLISVLYDEIGTTRPLCTVHVDVVEGDGNDSILARAEAEVNTSPTCQTAGVSGALSHGGDMALEDDFERSDTFQLAAPGLGGTQIVPAIHTAPGEAQDLCFSLFGLRQPATGHSQPLQFRILTGPTGASGGELTLVQDSPFGTCSIGIPTMSGENGFDLAPRLATAFQASGMPGPNPDCPAEANVRDVTVTDDTLSMLFASDIRICTSDAGIGFVASVDGAVGELPPAAVPVIATVTECSGPSGADVVLDGRMSSDPDSTPGTNDDIVLFEWFEDFGQASQVSLGNGELIGVPLSLGDHAITLRVTDNAATTDHREVIARVVDTTPPTGVALVVPDTLFPPNHEMIPVTLDVTADDLCGSVAGLRLLSASSDEPDDAPGNTDGATSDDVQDAQTGTFDLFVELRAERDGAGSGRTYTLTYQAEDEQGNAGGIQAQVSVPLDIAGVVEPLMIFAHHDASGLWFDWNPVSGVGVVSYNVVRGELGNIVETPEAFDMGVVEWVEVGSPDPSTASHPDTVDPTSGVVFLYLAESTDDLGDHGYSTLGLKPRMVNEPSP